LPNYELKILKEERMYSRKLISLDEARRVGDAALARAMEHPDRPMAIAVVDAMGVLVYFVKMDGAPLLATQMPLHKAYTVINFSRDTADVEKFLADDPNRLATTDFGDQRLTRIPGGVALRAPDGTLIGAIGTSGRAPHVDKVSDLDVALAGAKAL
jgi:uncharacterized protein GlcG (DUF336 family)